MIQLYNITGKVTVSSMNNGMTILAPSSCVVRAEVNGTWELSMEHPLDIEGRWKDIQTGLVIRAKSFNGDQLFRIKRLTKTDSSVVVDADPIALDAANDCFLMDVRPSNATGQQALTAILGPNSKYTGHSNITTRSTAYYIRKNALEAISGEENSFLKRWGGELWYDNFDITINTRCGADNGVIVRPGKNLPREGLRFEADTSAMITRIVPLAYNGHPMSGDAPWVSAVAPPYDVIHTAVMTFENVRLANDNGFSDGETIPAYITLCANQTELDAALTAAAEQYFTETQCNNPRVTLEADLIALESTNEYMDFKGLEKVNLGDTVYLYNANMGIGVGVDGSFSPQAIRVREIEYDCIRERVLSLTARTDESSVSYSGSGASVGGGDPFSVDTNGNVIIGNKLIFGDPTLNVPTYLQRITGNTNGGVLLVRPGASLLAGGGEYASNRWGVGDITASNEMAFLGADSNVYIESNGNTIANRKTWTFDTSGNLTTPAGGLINDVDLSAIGTRKTYTSGTVSLTSGTTWQNILSMTFEPGVWIFNGVVSFPSNATGRRAFCISTTATGSQNALLNLDVQNAVNGAQTVCHINSQFVLTAQTTYYFNAYQNSGGALSVSPRFYAVRIK